MSRWSHAIVLQVQPGGPFTRVGLVVNASELLNPLLVDEMAAMPEEDTSVPTDPALIIPSETRAPPDSAAASALKDMFTRLDTLCEELGNTLREVVLAFAFEDTGGIVDLGDRVQTRQNAKLVAVLRGSMPRMVERRCLVVRREQSDASFDEVVEGVLEHDAWFWTNIKLND